MLKPILASHAPIVSIIKAKIGMFNIFVMYRNEGINRTRVNIMPSRHNKAISK